MWKRNTLSNRSIQLLGLLLLTFIISGTASATVTNLKPGWPRFEMNKIKVTNSGTNANAASTLATTKGITLSRSDTSLFTFESTGGKLKWKEGPGSGVKKTNNFSASMYAEIDTLTNTVVQGRIDIIGDILGFNGLQFGADLTSSLISKSAKVGFGQINHEGNVCDLGFCSYFEELLLIKNLNVKGGDFSKAFTKNNRKVVSTVPVPAAAWLFMSGILGLFGFSRKRA